MIFDLSCFFFLYFFFFQKITKKENSLSGNQLEIQVVRARGKLAAFTLLRWESRAENIWPRIAILSQF